MTDADRLRELQHKAFAPGGSLTAAEAAELSALQVARSAGAASASGDEASARQQSDALAGDALVSSPAASPPGAQSIVGGTGGSHVASDSPGASGAASAPDAAFGAAPDSSADPAAPAASVDPSEPDRSPRPATRRRLALMVAAVVTLLVGFGAGWLAFAGDSGPQMNAEQRATWTELESSAQYDAGSVLYTGARDDVSVWYATREAAQLRCIIVTSGERKQDTCQPASEDDGAWTLQTTLTLDAAEGEPSVGYFALLVKSTEGDWVPIIQRQDWGANYDWREQYSGTEREIAEMLDSKGFSGAMLQIIGYDADTPVWLSYEAEACILVADAEKLLLQGCGELNPDADLSVSGDGVTYTVRQTEMRGPVLTIIRIPTVFNMDGEQLDDKTGKPVE